MVVVVVVVVVEVTCSINFCEFLALLHISSLQEHSQIPAAVKTQCSPSTSVNVQILATFVDVPSVSEKENLTRQALSSSSQTAVFPSSSSLLHSPSTPLHV